MGYVPAWHVLKRNTPATICVAGVYRFIAEGSAPWPAHIVCTLYFSLTRWIMIVAIASLGLVLAPELASKPLNALEKRVLSIT